MKKLTFVAILVATSLFAGTVEARKPIVKIDIPKEDVAKMAVGQLLDRTGLGAIAGVTHGGKVKTTARACVKNRRGAKICAFDQEGTIRLP